MLKDHYDEKDKTFIREFFLSFCESRGYYIEPQSPIISKEQDETVVFIGSSTNIFKKYLLREEPFTDPGISLYQEKIRTQNYKNFYSAPSEFSSFFEGGGVLTPVHRYQDLLKETIDFLSEGVGVHLDNLAIDVASSSKEFDIVNEVAKKKGVDLIVDKKPSSYYEWKFGVPGIFGHGIIFSIKRFGQAPNGEFGTLVMISDERSENIAVEWGFGTETLLSKLYGYRHPISCSLISKIYPYEIEEKDINFCDIITTCLVILDELLCEERKPESARTVLRRYLSALKFYVRESELPDAELKKIIDYLCNQKFKKNKDTGQWLTDYLKRARKLENRFVKGMKGLVETNPTSVLDIKTVEKQLKKKQSINVFQLAELYGYTNLPDSKFFSTIKDAVDMNGNIKKNYYKKLLKAKNKKSSYKKAKKI